MLYLLCRSTPTDHAGLHVETLCRWIESRRQDFEQYSLFKTVEYEVE